jgi:sorting nexin-7/30/sorting nexin-8
MEEDENQKEKQNFLRKNILEKGIDAEKFVDFLQEKKGEDGADITNWTMDDLKLLVNEFYKINNISYDDNNINENKEENEINNTQNNNNNIKFIIDEDSLMNLFQKKENQNNNINNNKPLFDFEKNFAKLNEQQKKININKNQNNNISTKKNEIIEGKNNTDKNENNKTDSLPNNNKEEIIQNNENNNNEEIDYNHNISNEEEQDIDYGIIINDTVKCELMEKTEFSEHKDIKIEIKNPIKLETKFFSGKSVNYSIITYPFNYIVERRYSDFIWLRDILSNLYNNILIPKMRFKGKVTKDKHDNNFIKKRMNYLERFINYIIKDDIIKSSQILYDFLTIKKYEDFIYKKKQYEKIKIFNFIDIKNRKNINGILDIKINKEKEIYLENIKDNTIYNGNLFKKLNNNFKSLNDEFNLVIKRIENISNIFKQIYDISNKYLDLNIIKESYSQMELMFKNLGDNFNILNNFIKTEIKQHFKFIGNNFISLNEMIQNVEISKNNYIKIAKHLINKKNELYKKGDISKYELKEKINFNNKNQILNKMLPQETKNSIKNKMIYGFYLNEIIKEYEKMRKINSYFFKKKICFFCKEQISICSDYTRILGDIIMIIDSCTNHS